MVSRSVTFVYYDTVSYRRVTSSPRKIEAKFTWALVHGNSLIGLFNNSRGAHRAMANNKYRDLLEVVQLHSGDGPWMVHSDFPEFYFPEKEANNNG